MARMIGAIASSHTRTIGFALDRNKQDGPVADLRGVRADPAGELGFDIYDIRDTLARASLRYVDGADQI